MAQIFFGWELGANLGHFGKFLPLARALRTRGHSIDWAVAADRADILDAEGFTWHAAPRAVETPRDGPPLSYADIMLRFGYADAANLRGLVAHWRKLIQASGATIVLADFAPTALLAARTLDLPAALYSSGFCVPPRTTPCPALRPWQPMPAAQLQQLENAVLASINQVLDEHGRAPLSALWQLFDVAENTLLGFPELDHCADRGQAHYWGGLSDAGGGAPPPWPALPGPKLFAYLRRTCTHHEAALAALYELGLPAVVFFPDLTAELEARFAAPHLVFSRVPIDLGAVATTATAAITYGGMSTVTQFLLAGKPLLLLPGQLEQYLLARRIVALGAGLSISPERPPAGLALALRRLIAEPGHAAAAQAFARKYAAFPQEVVVANLVRRIEEIADGPKENP